MSSYLAVLKNSYFLHLWLGQITSQIAVNMLAFILLIRVYQNTMSNIAVSGMILAIGIPAIVVGILAGGIVDQVDKRLVLIYCNILRALVLVLFYWFSSSLAFIYLLGFVFSIITQFFVPAEAPSIPTIVKNTDLLTANSLFTFSLYVATIIGFVLSGPALRLFGNNNIYIFLAGLMGLSAMLVMKLPKDKKKNNVLNLTWAKMIADGRDGIRFIRKNKRIEQSLFLLTFTQALIAILASLAPGFADKTLAIVLEDSSYLVMGPAAVGLILGSLVIGAWGKFFLKRILILVGIMGTGLTLLLLSFLVRVSHQSYLSFYIGNLPLGGLEAAIIILVFLGFTNSLVSVPANTVLQEDTQGDIRGRVYGALTSLTGGAAILPVLLSGILADTIGIGKTLFIIGIGVLLFGFYRVLKLPTTSFNIEK
ncbi:MFS transporter [Candidatus Gottesmanbacteria bacterium]|nr:MFS transporter [Candidatus Gottesmanbacteria bacterium]